ncbi:probable 4-coumarate--CoA ligase 3 [Drosophila innubila]|uniref:probable 4-coumarate--CoA ligase 3 n=1 Tax=Drosophila innubila TaxID=198719 RepID=UPI00148E75E0|nr:probable 4-coumarate--CoA ligase 3 [Drosophila innubila]
MQYTPEIYYNADQKIWSGKEQPAYFSTNLSIGEIIFHEMQRHPKLIAQISDTENTSLSWEELFLNSKRVASYLRNLKLEQSDIVGIIARNTTHISAVAYGCFFNGIAFHSVYLNYEQGVIEKLFDITKPKIIFCDGDEYEKVKAATEKLNVKIVTMRNHRDGSISIQEVLTTPIEPNFKPARLEQGNNQNLAILCTSGTTGTPKAVTIPNTTVMVNMCSFVTSSDVLYVQGSLEWLSGLVITILSGIRSALRIISDKNFSPADILRLVKKHKVTFIIQASAQMAQIANCPEFEGDCLDSLLYCLYGAANCSIKVQQSFRRRLSSKCILILGYGLTELGAMASFNYHFDQKPNSSGRLGCGNKLKILNEQGESLGPNEVGEVCLDTGRYWAGYYGNPEETRKIRDNNMWYHTGDLGYVDEDGFLFIVDRKKDMLKYQSIMYYPQEIENVIAQIPEISEVCVFGNINIFNGDEAAAAVVKKHGAQLKPQDVIDYVAKHVKATYLQLTGGVFIVDDLKRTASGKTDRRATRAYCLQNDTDKLI